MLTDKRFENINLAGIDFLDDGMTVRLTIVESVPPYDASYIVCRNAVIIHIYRDPIDKFPMFIGEFAIRRLEPEELSEFLRRVDYPILSESGALCVLNPNLVLGHFEGAVVGDILAEQIAREPLNTEVVSVENGKGAGSH